MAVLRSPLDIESTPRPRTRGEYPVGLASGEGDPLRHQASVLARRVARLTEELVRLRQENVDLKDAAAIWIRLYERQLSRANEATQKLGYGPTPPR